MKGDLPGLMRSLSASGYQTALYAPSPFSQGIVDEMYHSLGVERRVYVDETHAGGPDELSWRRKARCDRACLEALREGMLAP